MRIDRHCHIVPGVDDGSPCMRESIAMLRAAQQVGITHIVCTPHCKGSHFNAALIDERYEQLLPYATDIGLCLALGYEVYYDNLLHYGVSRARDLCTRRTTSILIEFSLRGIPFGYERTLYDLLAQGLEVTIAHPERYPEVQDDVGVARHLVEMGCHLQLSANCMDKGRFNILHTTACKLYKEELVSCIASDAHRVDDYAFFSRGLKRFPSL